MPNQTDIANQQQLLETHRYTLQILLQQQAMHGTAYAPPAIFHGIRAAREQIQLIKQTLRGWQVAVDDNPNDAEAASSEQPRPEAAQVNELLKTLDLAYKTFASQVSLRNKLVDMIRQRLPTAPFREFEIFFLQHYRQLNEAELFFHQRVRALTVSIQFANRRALELANQLQIDQAVPSLPDLRAHLTIWLNKYDQVFQHAPHMCVLYVGVEEGVRFPRSVEEELRDYLKAEGR
ncbi:MAG: hypothetical protein MUD01_06925 [Chloroflexaceae bacterium]|jgi:hypothetical protein|nr:hypothetical protein [Chloroflexaceae bacterium]